ncbi:MAG: Uncharacterized protein XD91_0418 [Clostridiales bacterium 38_11]|nr:MAG: Uncharacterized protein XD91_0418 [Clostridiales bacterium 38_11]HBH12052.1 hypothetical protein [Clostridiales bacterium]
MNIFSRLKSVLRLLFNSRIRFVDKIPIILMLFYILNPIDLIPLPVLGFGILDDLVVFVVLLKLVDRTLLKYYNEEKKDLDPDHIIVDVDYEIDEKDDSEL